MSSIHLGCTPFELCIPKFRLIMGNTWRAAGDSFVLISNHVNQSLCGQRYPHRDDKMAVAPARKFTEAQLFFLEAEFNNGLTSTSMVKYGDRFRDLHEKTDLPIDQLQRWINNRSRGPRPTCFIRPNVNDDGVNMEAEKQDQKTAANIRKQEATGLYKKPPSTKIRICSFLRRSLSRTKRR